MDDKLVLDIETSVGIGTSFRGVTISFTFYHNYFDQYGEEVKGDSKHAFSRTQLEGCPFRWHDDKMYELSITEVADRIFGEDCPEKMMWLLKWA